jgi:hypothetical protein
MDYTHLPLIPAQAGIQVEGTSASPNLLGPRFRGDERMGVVGSIPVKVGLVARFAHLRYWRSIVAALRALDLLMRPDGRLETMFGEHT